MKNNSTTIHMEVDTSNKLVAGAPSINYDVDVNLTQKDDGTFDFKIEGVSDGFPAYEFFITNEVTNESYLIYGSNPEERGDTPTALFPPMDQYVNGRGNSNNLNPVKDNEQGF